MKNFNEDIRKIDDDDMLLFLHKYIFHGIPYVFRDEEKKYFDFRMSISNFFNVHYTKIFIVGSAKLGFSYHKNTKFSLESDIDVVIVDEGLFNKYYEQIADIQYALEKHLISMTIDETEKFNKFKSYLIKGWLRPDLLPMQLKIKAMKKDWFKFFNDISYKNCLAGDYKVSAGLYKNYTLLEKYHLLGLKNKKEKLNMEEKNE